MARFGWRARGRRVLAKNPHVEEVPPVLAWKIARSFRVWSPGAFDRQNGR